MYALATYEIPGPPLAHSFWASYTPVEGTAAVGMIVVAGAVTALVLGSLGRLRLTPDQQVAWGFATVVGPAVLVLSYADTPLSRVAEHVPGLANNPIWRSRFLIAMCAVILLVLLLDALWRPRSDRATGVRTLGPAPVWLSRAAVVVLGGMALRFLPRLVDAADAAHVLDDIGRDIVENLDVAAVAAAIVVVGVLRSRLVPLCAVAITGLVFWQVAWPVRDFTPTAPRDAVGSSRAPAHDPWELSHRREQPELLSRPEHDHRALRRARRRPPRAEVPAPARTSRPERVQGRSVQGVLRPRHLEAALGRARRPLRSLLRARDRRGALRRTRAGRRVLAGLGRRTDGRGARAGAGARRLRRDPAPAPRARRMPARARGGGRARRRAPGRAHEPATERRVRRLAPLRDTSERAATGERRPPPRALDEPRVPAAGRSRPGRSPGAPGGQAVGAPGGFAPPAGVDRPGLDLRAPLGPADRDDVRPLAAVRDPARCAPLPAHAPRRRARRGPGRRPRTGEPVATGPRHGNGAPARDRRQRRAHDGRRASQGARVARPGRVGRMARAGGRRRRGDRPDRRRAARGHRAARRSRDQCHLPPAQLLHRCRGERALAARRGARIRRLCCPRAPARPSGRGQERHRVDPARL